MNRVSNILIIDDSVELLEVFEYFLKEAGYTVRTAKSVPSIIPEIISFKPDIILLDVKLNGYDGRDICKSLKGHEDTKHIPIILMSAYPNALNNYAECLADETLEKPFNLADVKRKIELVLQSKNSKELL